MAGNSHGNSRKNGNPAAHLKDYQFKPGQSGNATSPQLRPSQGSRPRSTASFPIRTVLTCLRLATCQPHAPRFGCRSHPRGTKEFAELIAKETRDGAELVEYALSVLRSESAKAPKVWAVEYLTERMLGKAPQTIELSDNDPPNQMPARDFRDFTEAELVALQEQAKLEAKNEAEP